MSYSHLAHNESMPLFRGQRYIMGWFEDQKDIQNSEYISTLPHVVMLSK